MPDEATVLIFPLVAGYMYILTAGGFTCSTPKADRVLIISSRQWESPSSNNESSFYSRITQNWQILSQVIAAKKFVNNESNHWTYCPKSDTMSSWRHNDTAICTAYVYMLLVAPNCCTSKADRVLIILAVVCVRCSCSIDFISFSRITQNWQILSIWHQCKIFCTFREL